MYFKFVIHDIRTQYHIKQNTEIYQQLSCYSAAYSIQANLFESILCALNWKKMELDAHINHP